MYCCGNKPPLLYAPQPFTPSSSKEAFCGGASCSGAHSHAPVARRAVLSGAAMGAAALAGGAANAAAALDERRGEVRLRRRRGCARGGHAAVPHGLLVCCGRAGLA